MGGIVRRFGWCGVQQRSQAGGLHGACEDVVVVGLKRWKQGSHCGVLQLTAPKHANHDSKLDHSFCLSSGLLLVLAYNATPLKYLANSMLPNLPIPVVLGAFCLLFLTRLGAVSSVHVRVSVLFFMSKFLRWPGNVVCPKAKLCYTQETSLLSNSTLISSSSSKLEGLHHCESYS